MQSFILLVQPDKDVIREVLGVIYDVHLYFVERRQFALLFRSEVHHVQQPVLVPACVLQVQQ